MMRNNIVIWYDMLSYVMTYKVMSFYVPWYVIIFYVMIYSSICCDIIWYDMMRDNIVIW